MFDEGGNFFYGAEQDGIFYATDELVGRADPKGKATKKGPRKDETSAGCKKHQCGGIADMTDVLVPVIQGEAGGLRRTLAVDPNGRRLTHTTGTVKNLVVLLRFNDHQNRALPSVDDIDTLFNSETADQKLCPSGSIKMVYHELSYGKLTIESTVTDWFLTSKTESWYADGDSG